MSDLYAHITTNQRAFNACARHLAKQGRAATSGYYCVYLTPDGLRRCAVGGLMPVKTADRAARASGSVHQLVERIGSDFGQVDVELLAELQNVHDSSRDGSMLRRLLRDVADMFNLDSSVLDKVSLKGWKP